MNGDDLVAMILAGPRPAPPPPPVYALPPDGPYDCQACGACCVEAGTVPVYPDETGVPQDVLAPFKKRADLETPPGTQQVAKHMGGRCKALTGEIGACVGCSIYETRPRVCASFAAGSEGCRDARLRASRKIANPEPRYRGYSADWQETV